MKLKKFFKPLVTVSALSMLLMGCAEDSSNGNGGDSTTTPTAQSVFMDFLAGFQSAPAQNATALEFTTKTTDKKPLNVAKDAEAVKYLVSLDNVMATYYATFGITGTSTTLLTPQGDNSITGLSGETKIKNYAKVEKGEDTASIDLTLTNGTVSSYTGMFALMTEENVLALDTALGDLDKAIEDSKPIDGDTDTPVLDNIDVAAVQKVVDLINGNMYKVVYNSPAQSVEAAFEKAQPLTLGADVSMKFTEGATATTFEIEKGLTFAGATPEGVVEADSVVVFLDEFKNILNGVEAVDAEKDTVKGETDLTTNSDLGITTDTLTSSATQKKIIYTPADVPEAGNNKVTYIAIVDSTTNIDSADSKLGALNKAIANGANKEQVEAALAELDGKIYKVEYSVDTIANLIETFKASVNVESAKTLETTDSTNYKADINSGAAFANNKTTVYCLSVSTETPRLVLNKLDGNNTTADNALENYVLKAKAKGSDGDGTISFTLEQNAEVGVPLYAYCSEAKDRSSDGDAFETALQTGTNYEKLDAFFQALQGELVVYSYTKASE